jgi:hypothetical protein
MMNATREKTRLWLLTLVGVVATLLGQTHAREIFAPSPHESGVFAAQTQASTGENYDACQYDTLGSLLAANTALVIIGENMSRVNSYAGKVGGETIDGWLAGRKWTQQLNDDFVSTMRAQGRQIQDIGPDFGRRLQNRIDPNLGRPPSSVYGGERQSLLDYGNYQRLYERTGKYQGGVPGFDP